MLQNLASDIGLPESSRSLMGLASMKPPTMPEMPAMRPLTSKSRAAARPISKLPVNPPRRLVSAMRVRLVYFAVFFALALASAITGSNFFLSAGFNR